jgi:L-threonylcarbamoyladenylate synthase
LLAACNALQDTNKSCAALLIGAGEAPDCKVITLPNQPEKVAEQLYSALHALDAMKVDHLLVELPPAKAEWMAVLDRLSRAGHQ